eukprot:5755-Pelagococcus_subviridis.AAC.3
MVRARPAHREGPAIERGHRRPARRGAPVRERVRARVAPPSPPASRTISDKIARFAEIVVFSRRLSPDTHRATPSPPPSPSRVAGCKTARRPAARGRAPRAAGTPRTREAARSGSTSSAGTAR